VDAFKEDVLDKILLLNVEYKLSNNVIAVTLVHPSTNEDIGKGIISDGFLHVQKHRDRRLTKLVSQFLPYSRNCDKIFFILLKYEFPWIVFCTSSFIIF
jgi:hypothetical protein